MMGMIHPSSLGSMQRMGWYV